MDDVAAELGMSKKTIYQYFADKNELVCTFLRNKLKVQRSLIDELKMQSENSVDEIFKNLELVRELFLNINPILFYDLQKYHPDAWTIFQQFRNEYLYHCIESNILKGVAEGYYRENLDIDILTRLRLEQIDMVLNQQAFPPATYHAAQVMISITEHFVYGISTPAGQALITQYQSLKEEKQKL